VTRGLTDRQRAYLEFLTSEGPTVFDETRCMGKIPALREVLGDAVLVHLHRHPAAFVSSNLLPSDRLDVLGLRRRYNRRTLFSRSGGFNGWGMEELSRTDHVEPARALLAEVAVDLPPRDERVPAAQRLLAMWLGAYRLAEREGRAAFGARFVSTSFEDLCDNPAAELAAIYAAAGAGAREFDTSELRPAAPGHALGDPRWREFAARVGFDDAELARFFPAAGA
jgi:hypothetical protein